MILEFNTEEIIEILKSIGYEVREESSDIISHRQKYFHNKKRYFIKQEGQDIDAEEVFKQEIIKRIFKLK